MGDTRRDDRLFSEGPKRILTLDGGGIRGMLTLGILEHVERILKGRSLKTRQDSFVLADYFDLIAGTSTGSIIATLLALGRPVADIQAIYRKLGPKVFDSPSFLGQVLWTKFDAAELEAFLTSQLGDMQLSSDALRTGLLICSKRVDTGSAWLVANNPRAVYWDKDRHRKLRQLVRASTAAPTYFKPAILPVDVEENGVFVDGAMAGCNNPSLSAFMYATADEYGLRWKTGEDQLYLLSVGTGFQRPRLPSKYFVKKAPLAQAIHSLSGLVYETSMTAQHTLQALSQPRAPFQINTEVKGLERTMLGGAPLLQYERIDPPLEASRLSEEFGLSLPKKQQENLHRIDLGARKHIDALLKVGRAAGEQLHVDLFPRAFDGP